MQSSGTILIPSQTCPRPFSETPLRTQLSEPQYRRAQGMFQQGSWPEAVGGTWRHWWYAKSPHRHQTAPGISIFHSLHLLPKAATDTLLLARDTTQHGSKVPRRCHVCSTRAKSLTQETQSAGRLSSVQIGLASPPVFECLRGAMVLCATHPQHLRAPI